MQRTLSEKDIINVWIGWWQIQIGLGSAFERGGEDGQKEESTYRAEGVKVNESANGSLIFVMAYCFSEVDKTWSDEGLFFFDLIQS